MKLRNYGLIKAIEKTKSSAQEAQQQYSTNATTTTQQLSNVQGSEGDLKITRIGNVLSLAIKGPKEWLTTALQDSKGVVSTPSTSVETVVVDPGTLPGVSITGSLVNNNDIELSWSISNFNSFTIKRREGSSWNQGTNETTISSLSNFNYSSPYTDTTTAASTTYVYEIRATNGTGDTVDQTNAITTNALATAFNLIHLTGSNGADKKSYGDTELVEAAEFTDLGNAAWDNIGTIQRFLNNTDFANGGILYTDNSASSVWNATTFGVNDGGQGDEIFAVDGDIDKIFQVSNAGVLSNVISCKPAAPTGSTGTANSSTSITLSINGDMRVTSKLKVERKQGSGSYTQLTSTLSPSSSGSLSDSNVTTSYPDPTTLQAGITYTYKVTGLNDVHTGTSYEFDVTTTTAGTAWSSVPSDFSLTGFGFYGSDISNGEQITLSNGSGSTTIQCDQSGISGTLEVAVSTQGDPGTNGTSNGATGFSTSKNNISGNGNVTYYLRFKYTRLKSVNDNSAQTITFTNNSVSNTALDVTCIGTG